MGSQLSGQLPSSRSLPPTASRQPLDSNEETGEPDDDGIRWSCMRVLRDMAPFPHLWAFITASVHHGMLAAALATATDAPSCVAQPAGGGHCM